METKITMAKTKTIQEKVEDLMDQFNFIKCHDIQFEILRDLGSKKMHELRIRDLKNDATEALEDVINQAQKLKSSGENKFGKILKFKKGHFLAIAEWVEEWDQPYYDDEDVSEITRYEEQIYLELYYFAESMNTAP